jgi:pimeloyl-ACP methyl ester carboxylesterase
MTRKMLWLSMLASSALYAQDIAGDWQGTLKAGPAELRLIVKIAKAPSGGWNATLFSIDQSPDFGAGMAADSVTLEGSNLKFSVAQIRGKYEGKLNADGNSIEGAWNQVAPLPLELKRATPETAWKDPSPHTARFVTVDKDVKLEVLDWGGSGRPVVLLTGLGNTAHIYDKFAPKLTSTYHVYGITRRGYGASTAPTSGYEADRLGDDVLAVVDSLQLARPPILVGHSIGGEELSSIGSRRHEKVAALIYLDAGYSYAFYDRDHGNLLIDLLDLQKKMGPLLPGVTRTNKPLVQEILDTVLPAVERDLRESLKNLETTPPALQAQAASQGPPPFAAAAIMAGQQKYTNIPAPVLAIYALPHDPGPIFGNDAEARARFEAREEATVGAQVKAFEAGVPTAHVVRLPRANHYVFISNEADVLREMNTFIGGLK